jgi:DNA-binding winged helix-turn-helix (wHTH) protein/tetratricopeptide (TPR) repeat protein
MPHSNHHYEFGPYRLNLAQRVLTRDGEIVSLTPKATEILVQLVTNAGQLLEKDDLLKEVWPDTFVEEANLTQNIFTLRRALGDERAGPKYIETVSRRGYRFVAEVRVCVDDQQSSAVAEADGDKRPDDGDVVSPRTVVAVIPFLNATGDQALEYLAEGVTDNIINTLSRISRLRVMSRSAVFRHSPQEDDPQSIGKELGATAVLVGKITSRPTAVGISVELVEVATGWQLWGESFDCESKDLLQIQDAITRQLLANLKLKLTGEEEKHVTARYTENAQAYQAYLEGRYHWSRYTRKGIETAIKNFRRAIELDPNYALAYAAIVDCYLRLATNYLPPEGDVSIVEAQSSLPSGPESKCAIEFDPRVRLRFEWDWKGVERELRRANELKTDYPAAHQWYAAYRYAEQLLESSTRSQTNAKPYTSTYTSSVYVPRQIALLQLTPNEQVQVYCAIAREQIDAGNYDAACRILQSRWLFGDWPNLDGLSQQSCADLLFTCGELAGCVASTRQLPKGQKQGEALLSGSIAIFEQLASKRRAAEGRIELALCYYRQGLFDLGRSTLVRVLDTLSEDDSELRSLALIRLASLERHAGHLDDALSYLYQARSLLDSAGPWASGRCNLELASTYKDLASEEITTHFENAKEFYWRALHEFEAVGNHRLTAIVENNLGFLFLLVGDFSQSEAHLLRARRMFSHFDDRIRRAQVDDSLARLYLAQQKLHEAVIAIEQSVQTMEIGDEDALLAESLTTKGMVYCALRRYSEAEKVLESAYRLASRCGDTEGAGRAVLIIIEEISDMLEPGEHSQMKTRLLELLSTSQQASTKARARKCIEIIDRLLGHSES